jgi:radical SAM/Cys-rich protein
MDSFADNLRRRGLELRRQRLETLQLNVGRKCNQACSHCHVDAAPWRTEMMTAEVADKVMGWVQKHRPKNVDITGGAPELNTGFRRLVVASREAGCHVMDRCNLTILFEPGQEDLGQFLADHQVEIVASLPCYSEENVRKQRGNQVFEKSIKALKLLNRLGYGTELKLHLVYNPVGPKLPAPQKELEADYKEVLLRDFGIRFHQLFTITNQPIARFAEDLRKLGAWDGYMELLVANFNPGTIEGLMCRSTLSVGYDGRLFDCDFNQMLEMELDLEKARMDSRGPLLWEIEPDDLNGLKIRTASHCFACTAGTGSSCTGAIA